MVKDIRRPQVGKWFFDCGVGRPYHVSEIGWYHFRFCLFKLLRAPKDGGTLEGAPRRGIIISFLFWLPIWR